MNFKRWILSLVALALIVVLTLATAKPIGEVLTTAATPKALPTIIVDAGHAALENTIIIPKKHRQANVEIIPKTRCISGF